MQLALVLELLYLPALLSEQGTKLIETDVP